MFETYKFLINRQTEKVINHLNQEAIIEEFLSHINIKPEIIDEFIDEDEPLKISSLPLDIQKIIQSYIPKEKYNLPEDIYNKLIDNYKRLKNINFGNIISTDNWEIKNETYYCEYHGKTSETKYLVIKPDLKKKEVIEEIFKGGLKLNFSYKGKYGYIPVANKIVEISKYGNAIKISNNTTDFDAKNLYPLGRTRQTDNSDNNYGFWYIIDKMTEINLKYKISYISDISNK